MLRLALSRLRLRSLGIKVGRLQRRRRRFALARLCSFLSLQSIAHPFAHVWLLTQPHSRGQWMTDKRTKTASRNVPVVHRISAMPIPPEIHGQKYVSVATFRKNGTAVWTPVWFGEGDDKLYVMSRSDSGKYKRIRNNPQLRVAPCTIRGRIIGPEFAGVARILPPEDWPGARKTLERRYWLLRIPFLWSKKNVYIEINITA